MIAANELRIGDLVHVKDKRNSYFKETYKVLDIFGKSGLVNLQDIESGFFKPRYPIIFVEPLAVKKPDARFNEKYINNLIRGYNTFGFEAIEKPKRPLKD